MKQIKVKSSGLLLVICLLSAVVLVACGDSATSTPAAPANTPLPVVTAGNSVPTAALNSGTTAAATTAAAVTTTAAAATTTTAAAATTAAATTTTAAASGVKKGGSLTTAVSGGDTKTLHVYRQEQSITYEYLQYLFNAKLTRRDPKTIEVIGLAANSWQVDPATATVTFKLKPGLKWSDGQPITSADYVWTYQQAIKKENGWPGYSAVVFDPKNPQDDAIEDYTATDDMTIKVKMHGVTFNIVEAADQIEPLPKHIWEGKDWNDPTKNPEIEKPSVVSGAWKLKEWVRDNRFVVVRNENSTLWPVPNLDQISYVVVPNSSVAFQKLKNGEIDFYRPDNQDEPEAETLPSLQVYKWQTPGINWDYIGINFRKPYLQDVKLRQALMWTVDKKTLVDKVIFGLGAPLYSDVPQASVFYNDKIEKYGYDPEKAKQILKDAGYTVKDGKLIDPKGQPLPKMRMRHVAPSSIREKTAAVLQQEWKNLGIDLELVTSDSGTLIKALQSEPFDYDFWLANWTAGINPETFGGIWRDIPTSNRGAWVNEQVNTLYSQAVKELDFNKRKEIMFKIQEIEAKDLPYLYYFARVSYLAVNKKIGGITPSPLGLINESVNQAYQWYIQ